MNFITKSKPAKITNYGSFIHNIKKKLSLDLEKGNSLNILANFAC